MRIRIEKKVNSTEKSRWRSSQPAKVQKLKKKPRSFQTPSKIPACLSHSKVHDANMCCRNSQIMTRPVAVAAVRRHDVRFVAHVEHDDRPAFYRFLVECGPGWNGCDFQVPLAWQISNVHPFQRKMSQQSCQKQFQDQSILLWIEGSSGL